MNVTIELSSQLKRAVGQREVCLELPDLSTITDAARALAASFPQAAPFLLDADQNVQAALILFVSDEQVQPGHALVDGSRITILAPISGG